MAPIRTVTLPKQPLKTERTHEENQERAYIAASRRSDRSLEARIESARRASEIHKRRTGRSLRVTEQDVVNEEMYEEEDDVLPLQYRRLTAHLSTSSPDFNRHIAAYVTNHVAMRNALALTSNMSLSNTGNVPQWGPSNFKAAQPWLESQKSLQTQQTGISQSPTGDQSPASPFTAPSILDQKPEHHRSSTFPSVDQSNVDFKKMLSNQVSNKRRTSCALDTSAVSSRAGSPSTFPAQLKTRSSSASLLPTLKSQKSEDDSAQQDQERPSKRAKQSKLGDEPLARNIPVENFGPLTTRLPRDTETFFFPFYSNDADAQQGAMAGLNFCPHFYDGPFNGSTKGGDEQHPRDGINQTLALAPSMLDCGTNFDTFGQDSWADSDEQLVSPFCSNMPHGFDNGYGNESSLKHMFLDSNSANTQASGSATPLDRDWSDYLNSSVWDDGTT